MKNLKIKNKIITYIFVFFCFMEISSIIKEKTFFAYYSAPQSIIGGGESDFLKIPNNNNLKIIVQSISYDIEKGKSFLTGISNVENDFELKNIDSIWLSLGKENSILPWAFTDFPYSKQDPLSFVIHLKNIVSMFKNSNIIVEGLDFNLQTIENGYKNSKIAVWIGQVISYIKNTVELKKLKLSITLSDTTVLDISPDEIVFIKIINRICDKNNDENKMIFDLINKDLFNFKQSILGNYDKYSKIKNNNFYFIVMDNSKNTLMKEFNLSSGDAKNILGAIFTCGTITNFINKGIVQGNVKEKNYYDYDKFQLYDLKAKMDYSSQININYADGKDKIEIFGTSEEKSGSVSPDDLKNAVILLSSEGFKHFGYSEIGPDMIDFRYWNAIYEGMFGY